MSRPLLHGRPWTWYRRGCRCADCHRAVRTAARLRYTLDQLKRGRDPATRVPVDRVRRHVEALIADGLSANEVARRAQVDPTTISRIRKPATERCSRLVARAVLAVGP